MTYLKASLWLGCGGARLKAERMGKGIGHWDYLGEGGVPGRLVAQEEPGKGRVVFCLR